MSHESPQQNNQEEYVDPTEGSIEVKSEEIDLRSISTPFGEMLANFSTLQTSEFIREVLISNNITQEHLENFPTENEGEGSPLKEIQKLLIKYHDTMISLEEKTEIGKQIAEMILNPEIE